MTQFHKTSYSDLNSRQQENYNFHKIAARLADYGYNCLRLTDDWQGADFIACHIDGETFLRVQLKGRPTISKKYEGKEIYIAFRDGDDCFVYPHDSIIQRVEAADKINSSKSWAEHRSYSWPYLPKWLRVVLDDYRI